MIRFKVAYDDGKVRCAGGETTSELPPATEARLVRVGLAEVVRGNRSVNHARAQAGLPALTRRRKAKK